MKARFLYWIVLLGVAACSSAPQFRYYSLSIEPGTKPVAKNTGPTSYALDEVVIPDSLNRPEIVLRADQNVSGLDYWAAAIPDMLRRTLDAVVPGDPADHPQNVPRAGQNSFEVLEYDRWEDRLPDMLRRTLAADLSSRLGASVTSNPEASSDPSIRRIAIKVFEFNTGRDGQVALDASWADSVTGARSMDDGLFTHRTRHVAFTGGADIKQMVAAMSKLLAALSDDIAATISINKSSK